MKQLLILSTLFINLSFFAQNEWPKEGAQWEICHFQTSAQGGDSYNSSSVVNYSKDTLINGVVYQVCEQVYQEGTVGTQVLTRYLNDTIFRLINQNEYLFFTYNTNVGDTLFMQRTGTQDYNQDTCSFSLDLKCTEVFTLNIDGENYSCWEFQDVGNSGYGTNYDGGVGYPDVTKFYWLETVGWLDYFPWVTQFSENFCNYFNSATFIQFPYLYSDNEITLDIPSQSHDGICDTLLNIKKEHIEHISIYPNPSSSKITISGLPQDNYTFQLTDNLGRVVMKGGLKNNKIDISRLKSGVYMLKLARKNELFYTKKIIKE